MHINLRSGVDLGIEVSNLGPPELDQRSWSLSRHVLLDVRCDGLPQLTCERGRERHEKDFDYTDVLYRFFEARKG